MDTFTIGCNCGTEIEIRVPSSLDMSNVIRCPSCSKTLRINLDPKRPAVQVNITGSPAPQTSILRH